MPGSPQSAPTPTLNVLAGILRRIEGRLRVVGLSAHAASRQAGRPDAIRNLRRAVEAGDRKGITTETLQALAPVLGTTAAWLLEGDAAEPVGRTEIRIVGRIGAGGEITPAEGNVGLPIIAPPGGQAFIVDDPGLWPRYEPGDVIICSPLQRKMDDLDEGEAVVETADGRRMLRRLVRGAKAGEVDLEGIAVAPIRGVKLAWAAPVALVVRATRKGR